MVWHTLGSLQDLLQGFSSVSDYFGTLYIKGLAFEQVLAHWEDCESRPCDSGIGF